MCTTYASISLRAQQTITTTNFRENGCSDDDMDAVDDCLIDFYDHVDDIEDELEEQADKKNEAQQSVKENVSKSDTWKVHSRWY